MLPRLGRLRRPFFIFALITFVGFAHWAFFSGPSSPAAKTFKDHFPTFRPDHEASPPPPRPGGQHGGQPPKHEDSFKPPVHDPPEDDPLRAVDTIPDNLPGFLKHAPPPPPAQPETTPAKIHWIPTPEHFPLPSSLLIPLPTSTPLPLPKVQATFPPETPAARKVRLSRLAAVRAEILHAYTSYRTKAFLHDEVRPVSGRPHDPFGGKAATLVDSLDTLYLIGAHREFEEAVKAVEKIDWTIWKGNIAVFETNIRYLGGLLGAYDISGGAKGKGKGLLKKAEELAEVLMGVFDTPNRLPVLHYAWEPEEVADPQRAPTRAVTAELGSLTLEFIRLAQLTSSPRYYDAVHRITTHLQEYQNRTLLPGLFPTLIDTSGCRPPPDLRPPPVEVSMHLEPPTEPETDGLGEIEEARRRKKVGVELGHCPEELRQGLERPREWYKEVYSQGGEEDSAYEYLIKAHILLGGTVPQYAEMWNYSQTVAQEKLYFKPVLPPTGGRDVLMAGQVTILRGSEPKFVGKTSHLMCFLGGMVGLGAKTLGMPDMMHTASGLTEGCVWAYNVTASGLMPEEFTIGVCDADKGGIASEAGVCEWSEERWLKAGYGYVWQEEREALPRLGVEKRDEGGLWKGLVEKVKRAPAPPKDRFRGFSAVEKARALAAEEGRPEGMVEINDSRYILRPEAIESVFYMHRLTASPHWADAGWQMFQSMIRSTRAPHGHSAISNVLVAPPADSPSKTEHSSESEVSQHLDLKTTSENKVGEKRKREKRDRKREDNWADSMESFWIAETLKYAYLLFSEPLLVSLDEYVFNTEAHAFLRPGV